MPLTSSSPEIEIFRLARKRARQMAEETPDRLRFARSLVKTALTEFAGETTNGRTEMAGMAAQLGQAARHLDLETAAYLLGTVYTAALPPEFRTTHGVFYTPPSACARLIAMAESGGVDWARVRVADISCGGGAFLAPVAEKILNSGKWDSPRAAASHLRAHLHGFELDPFSAWMSEIFLGAAFQRHFPGTECSFEGFVQVGDSLRRPVAEFGKFDLVIGNPPYGRVRLDETERERWSRSLYGHANLYGLFTDLAVQLVDDGGIVAYVTPASFLGGQYFESLRALLADEAPPIAIDFMASREGVFTDVLQEIVLVAFRRGERVPFPVSFTSLTETGPLHVEHGGTGSLPDDGRQPWLLPRSAEHVKLLARAKLMRWRLRDYGYEVSTGPLVWNRHKSRLGSSRGLNGIPVVWAESVNPQGTGHFAWKAEFRNHAPWYHPTGEHDMNLVKEPCVLVQRTTATEQVRRLIAAPLPAAFIRKHGAVAVENHLNMVRRRVGQQPLLDARAMAALLNSEVIDRVFRCINGSTAVSAYELESIPLPDPGACTKLTDLIEKGAARDAIDAFISGLYIGTRTHAAA